MFYLNLDIHRCMPLPALCSAPMCALVSSLTAAESLGTKNDLGPPGGRALSYWGLITVTGKQDHQVSAIRRDILQRTWMAYWTLGWACRIVWESILHPSHAFSLKWGNHLHFSFTGIIVKLSHQREVSLMKGEDSPCQRPSGWSEGREQQKQSQAHEMVIPYRIVSPESIYE